jgi:RNA polymerase I-specific transcription initiation factor RRN3
MLPPSLDWDDPASFIGQDLPWMTGLKSRLQANISSKLNVSYDLWDLHGNCS